MLRLLQAVHQILAHQMRGEHHKVMTPSVLCTPLIKLKQRLRRLHHLHLHLHLLRLRLRLLRILSPHNRRLVITNLALV
jgi:hypothetical protein